MDNSDWRNWLILVVDVVAILAIGFILAVLVAPGLVGLLLIAGWVWLIHRAEYAYRYYAGTWDWLEEVRESRGSR